MKLFFIFLLFICIGDLSAQDFGRQSWGRGSAANNNFSSDGSSLQGQVLNGDGSPAAGVSVRLTGLGGSQVVTTDSDGEFHFSDLHGGTYDLAADSGTLSAHRTVAVNFEASQITLRFDGPQTAEKGSPRASVSVQQLKVPDKARKEYEKAMNEAAKQNTEKALSRLSSALTHYSCYSDALTLKSVLDLGAGRVRPAADEAQQAIHCDGSNGKAYFVLGAALNAQQQYQDAICTLNEGIRFHPDAWQPYYELGKSLLGLHRAAEAVAQLKRAESLLHGSYPPLHAALGSALLEKGDYQDARAQLVLFLRQAPEHLEAERVKRLVAQIDTRLQSSAAQGRR